jgi:hypothetical protein
MQGFGQQGDSYNPGKSGRGLAVRDGVKFKNKLMGVIVYF